MLNLEDVEVGDQLISGLSLRLIKELNPRSKVYPKTEVVYALYRLEEEGWREELTSLSRYWLLLRQGYCSYATFNRFLRTARKL